MKTHYEKIFERKEGTVASLLRVAICGIWRPRDLEGKTTLWLLTSNKNHVTCKSCLRILRKK